MMDSGLRRDFPQALRIVWLVLGVVSGLIVLAPFVLPAQVLSGVFPMCSAKAAGLSCAFCGMTTAFLSIGGGDWAAAEQANAGSIPLFWALALNFAGACAYTMMRVIRHANT
ncbi:MAG TPA: DUF2752 domain-containing protein [Bryobacteraceae bacterium]|nr:DUF2752 domain-containing protein [Bryobacteraceae bacterium]